MQTTRHAANKNHGASCAFSKAALDCLALQTHLNNNNPSPPLFKRPYSEEVFSNSHSVSPLNMNGSPNTKSHAFETPSSLASHPYPHIKKIRLTLGSNTSVKRMQTYPGPNKNAVTTTLPVYPDTDISMGALNVSSSSPSLTSASTDILTPKSSSLTLDSPSPPFTGYREDSGWGYSSSSDVSSSSMAFSAFDLHTHHHSSPSMTSIQVDPAFAAPYFDSMSHLANISIEETQEQRLMHLSHMLVHPSTSVDPLEETDEHKEGTERKAREYVRKCLFNNKRLASEYHVRLLLGWGGNGAVLGARRVSDNKPVAIKLIYKSDSAQQAKTPATTPFPELPSELRILMGTRHCNIIHFLDWFEDGYAFYMVSERIAANWNESSQQMSSGLDDEIRPNDECITVQVPNPFHQAHSYSTTFSRMRIAVRSGASDMFSYIDACSTVPVEQRQKMFSKIACSLAFLHERGITHGDLKEENILLTEELNPKLCDFGHARKRGQSCRDAQVGKRVAFYGTRDMTPPELLSNLKKDRHSPSLKRYSGFEADVWALGLLLYSMCTGTLSTEHRRFIASASNHKYMGVYDQGGCLIYPGNYERILKESQQDVLCVDLLKKMLRISPTDRWSMDKVIAHPWIVQGLQK